MTLAPRGLLSTVSILPLAVLLVGCAEPVASSDSSVTAAPADSSAARTEWFQLSAQVDATQKLVGGEWEFSDTNARECGDGGAQWGITRLGPGVPETERSELFDKVELSWRANGWDVVRTAMGGDAPGLQLRYPTAGATDYGFYIEFESTVHGTTIDAQTPCAAGDVDQLAKEQFAYNNTPGRTPSATPTP